METKDKRAKLKGFGEGSRIAQWGVNRSGGYGSMILKVVEQYKTDHTNSNVRNFYSLVADTQGKEQKTHSYAYISDTDALPTVLPTALRHLPM